MFFFGDGRFVSDPEGVVISIANQNMTSTDLILLLASAARGVPSNIVALELPDNRLEEIPTALSTMIVGGQLPVLARIDLSGNPKIGEAAMQALLATMKVAQAPRLVCKFARSLENRFLIIAEPLEES